MDLKLGRDEDTTIRVEDHNGNELFSADVVELHFLLHQASINVPKDSIDWLPAFSVAVAQRFNMSKPMSPSNANLLATQVRQMLATLGNSTGLKQTSQPATASTPTDSQQASEQDSSPTSHESPPSENTTSGEPQPSSTN